jgi:hypothetical protein
MDTLHRLVCLLTRAGYHEANATSAASRRLKGLVAGGVADGMAEATAVGAEGKVKQAHHSRQPTACLIV